MAGRFVYASVGRGITLRGVGLLVLLAQPLSLALFAVGAQMAVLFAFAVLFGLANGLMTIVRGALLPQYFGRAHIGRIGGAMSALGLFARAAAPLLAAWLLLAMPGYREVLLALTSALGMTAPVSSVSVPTIEP